jgi:hypothetical protein
MHHNGALPLLLECIVADENVMYSISMLCLSLFNINVLFITSSLCMLCVFPCFLQINVLQQRFQALQLQFTHLKAAREVTFTLPWTVRDQNTGASSSSNGFGSSPSPRNAATDSMERALSRKGGMSRMQRAESVMKMQAESVAEQVQVDISSGRQALDALAVKSTELGQSLRALDRQLEDAEVQKQSCLVSTVTNVLAVGRTLGSFWCMIWSH